jgi:hypothetical protein
MNKPQADNEILSHPIPPHVCGNGPSSASFTSVTQTPDLEQLNYQPVPARKQTRVSVHYRIRGRGQPLPFPPEEGDLA